MIYVYFISFSYWDDGVRDVGNYEISSRAPITSIENVKYIEDFVLTPNLKYEHIRVLSYQLMRTDKDVPYTQ